MTRPARRKLLSSLFVGFCGAVGPARAGPARVHPVLRRQPGDPVAQPRFLHPDAEAGRRSRRRHGQRDRRHADPDAVSASLMAMPIGVLSGIYMSEYAGTRFASAVAVRRRHAERRAVDRHRRLRLRRRRAAVQAVQRARRRPRARHHDDSDHRAHDRRAAAARARARCARARSRSARRARAPCSPSCCRRRCPASSPASCWRWRASPARPRRCSSRRSTTGSSRPASSSRSRRSPCRSTPTRSRPYEDWHRQAWAGALVLVVIVLICSLLARVATRRLERMHARG